MEICCSYLVFSFHPILTTVQSHAGLSSVHANSSTAQRQFFVPHAQPCESHPPVPTPVPLHRIRIQPAHIEKSVLKLWQQAAPVPRYPPVPSHTCSLTHRTRSHFSFTRQQQGVQTVPKTCVPSESHPPSALCTCSQRWT